MAYRPPRPTVPPLYLTMKIVNRTLILVMPKQSYVDWIVEIGMGAKGATEKFYSNDGGVYLYEEFDPRDFDSIIKDNYIEYFESELSDYTQDESTWPAQRTFEKFNEWFNVTHHSFLIDKAEVPLAHEKI